MLLCFTADLFIIVRCSASDAPKNRQNGSQSGLYGLARSRASHASKMAIHDDVGEFG
jgi:hypothetical protein